MNPILSFLAASLIATTTFATGTTPANDLTTKEGAGKETASKETPVKESPTEILVKKLETAVKNRSPLKKDERTQVRIQVGATMEKARSAGQFSQTQLKIFALANLLTEIDPEFRKSFNVESIWRRQKTITRPQETTLGEAEAFEMARKSFSVKEFDRALRKYESNLSANQSTDKYSFFDEFICTHYSSIRDLAKAEKCWSRILEAAAPGSMAQQRFSLAALNQLSIGHDASKTQVLIDKSKPYLLNSEFSNQFEMIRAQTAFYLADFDEVNMIITDMSNRPNQAAIAMMGNVLKAQVFSATNRCNDIAPIMKEIQASADYKDLAQSLSPRFGFISLKCKDYVAAVGYLQEALQVESWEIYLNLQKYVALVSAKWLANQKPDVNDRRFFTEYRKTMKSFNVQDSMTETLLQFGQMLSEANSLKSIKAQKLQDLTKNIMKGTAKTELLYVAADEILQAYNKETGLSAPSANSGQ